MNETFPRKPFLDRVIIREIPLEEFYQQSMIEIPLDREQVKDRSDRGVVVAVGRHAETEVIAGDVVFFDEFCLNDPVYLNPADKRRTDLPKYWQMRVADLKGFDVETRSRVLNELITQRQMEQIDQCANVPAGSKTN
jgi:co-chaperonin GroES (HSP10)